MTNKFYFALLLIGFLLVFTGNFFGFDLSDEGLAALGFTPNQQLGITFTHYQFLIQKLFPEGLDFIFARQLRLFLIILSSAVLLLSIYRSNFRKYFSHFVLLIAATTLISLGTGIGVLSYNGINQFLVTLYVASLIQYISTADNKKSNLAIGWLVFVSVIVGSIYIVRLPSFFPYVLLQALTIAFISWKNKNAFLLHIVIFFLILLLTILFLSDTVVPFSRVSSDMQLFAQMSSTQQGGHGFRLVLQYLIEFVQKLTMLFFSATAFYILRQYFKRVLRRSISFVLNIILFLAVGLILISPPLSISAFIIFFFSLLIVTYYANTRESSNLLKEWKKCFLGLLFPAIAIASTLGSNVWIINLLLFYLSIWMVSCLFFISSKNVGLFKKVAYLVVILAILKVLFTGFVAPHRQGSLLTEHKRFETQTRGTVFLDKEMFEYVTEIKSYLIEQNLYGQEIIAVSRLPGLVYLLDSNMPGSINFTDSYWQVYCESLNYDPPKNPVIIFRGNIPNELIECLADHGVDIAKDYRLGKTINIGFSIYKMPTYIYIKDD